MKPASAPFLYLLLCSGLPLTCGCSSTGRSPASRPIAATVELSGTPNAPITGYYIAQGNRVELSGVLPMAIHSSGLSQLAVRKRDSEDTLVLTARSQNGTASQTIRPKLDEGVRVLLDSLSLSSIPPQESLAVVKTPQIVLTLYWYEDAWVFDDATRGVQREPFVRGVPELLNLLSKDIPDARDGFRLTFSAKPFPGFQKMLTWVRADAGGNYYQLESKSMEGWLCPAMYRYFTKTPKVLYLKAESRKS